MRMLFNHFKIIYFIYKFCNFTLKIFYNIFKNVCCGKTLILLAWPGCIRLHSIMCRVKYETHSGKRRETDVQADVIKLISFSRTFLPKELGQRHRNNMPVAPDPAAFCFLVPRGTGRAILLAIQMLLSEITVLAVDFITPFEHIVPSQFISTCAVLRKVI